MHLSRKAKQAAGVNQKLAGAPVGILRQRFRPRPMGGRRTAGYIRTMHRPAAARAQGGGAVGPKEDIMLFYAVVFFVIALIAAVLGFSGIAAGAAGIAKVLFVVFLVMALVSFLANLARR
jgi:uncharacterized membrane protein YtjA (UPF0391 family)